MSSSRLLVVLQQQKVRILSFAQAVLVSLLIVPLGAHAIPQEDVGQIIDLVSDFKDKLDLIDKGGHVVASEPFQFKEEDYQRVKDYAHQLETQGIKPFAFTETASPEEMFSADPAVRKEALRKLNVGKADQEAYLQDLRAEREKYAAISDKWSKTADRLHDASDVIEKLIDNVGVSVIDELGGEQMLYGWLDITVYLTPLASEVGSDAKVLANNYAREIAHREQLLANYRANLDHLTRMDEAMLSAAAENDLFKSNSARIEEVFKDWDGQGPATHPEIDAAAEGQQAAALHAKLDEKLKAAKEREAAQLAKVKADQEAQARQQQEMQKAAAAALYLQQQQQAAAAAQAQRAAAEAAAAQQAQQAQMAAASAQAQRAAAEAQAAFQAQQAQQAAALAAQQAALRAQQEEAMRQWTQQQQQQAMLQQQQQWQQMQQSMQRPPPVICCSPDPAAPSTALH